MNRKLRFSSQNFQPWKSKAGEKYNDAEKYEKLVIKYLEVRDQDERIQAFFADKTHLTIQIKDENDEIPVFGADDFTYRIREDTIVGEPIEKVNFDRTSDADVTEKNR